MDNVQTESVITLELSVSEVNLVLGALRELPHRVVDGVLQKVVTQAQGQFKPPASQTAQ